ncbi:MAG: hypothetical protein PWR29_1454 [Methanolobus sp.]|nr:hypothetical protein [Methanolobus sp.]
MQDEAKSKKELIEELNRVRHRLRTSEELLRTFREKPEREMIKKITMFDRILSSVPDLVFCKDASGIYMECNTAFSEFVGLPIKEIIGKTDYDLFEKELADSFQANDIKMLQEGCPCKNDEWVVYPDGRQFFLATMKAPLRTAGGSIEGIIGVSRDITESKYTEYALKDLRDELFQIIDGNLVPMFVIDADHTIVHWNKACEMMTGLTAGEMIGSREPWRAFYPRKRPLLADLILDGATELISEYYGHEKLASSAMKEGCELQDYCPHLGKWFLYKGVPLRNVKGDVVGAIETFQDITSTKIAEEELAKQHEQLLSVFDAIDEPVYVCDPLTYELLFINSPLQAEHGKDVLGRKCYSVLQGRDSPCPFCTNDRIFGENLGKSFVWETRNNVNKRWYRCIDKALEWPDGRMVRFEMGIDITEHKLSEISLQKSEEKFEAISTFAQDAIIVVDNGGHVTFWNKAAERIFGYTREEALGQDVHLMLASLDQLDTCKTAFLSFKETGKGPAIGKNLEMKARRKDGSEFTVEISLSSAMLRNQLTAVAVIRDITERKEMEDVLLQAKITAENASCTKSEFLANMSHELRTPLNAIIGFSDLLLDGYFGELNEKQSRSANNISNSGRHLLGIINDILDLSKVESGKSKLEPEVLSVRSLLEEMISFMEPLAADKDIVLGLEIDQRSDRILADRSKLKQVLYNLIGNAIKFTDTGGSVTIRATIDEATANISVADTGIGIAPHDQEKLFKPFTQLDSSSSKQYNGTGLGLALAKELVELHKGRIWVESEPGKGSCFTFTLPVYMQHNCENER